MAYPLDVLLDDRSFIERGGDVVRCRADQLHAALMRLVIGFGAFEAGQKRMMDIDAAAGKLRCHFFREYLHVAREHDKLGVGRANDLQDFLFLLALRLFRCRQVMKGNALQVDMRVSLERVIGDDGGDLHREFADAASIEQIDEAVIEARDEDHHAPVLRA